MMNINHIKFALSAFLLLATTVTIDGLSLAATPPTPSSKAFRTVKGEVIIVAGELQKVKDGAGMKEVLIVDELYVVKNGQDEGVFLFVNEDTKLNGTLQVGDQVEAQVSADGHALSIMKEQ